MTEPTTIYNRPAELLQNLIRFDTTNPPGNEMACITYIQELCHSLGIETQIYSKDDNRPNLIARIKGNGRASPLLLYGHVDVVSTANQDWTHPPFSGDIADGFIWGRGALDMKDGVAMMTSAFLKAKADNIDLPGDVILCVVSDEEAGGNLGAKFLVHEHADLFEGVKYAIGEFGGFPMVIGGKKFFAIQTAEKGKCNVTATFRGPSGHGSMPRRSPNNATAKLAKALEVLNTTRLPVHITPAVEHMINALADGMGGDTGNMFRQMLNPEHTNTVVDELGDMGHLFDVILHNTASPTIVKGGDKENVIPAQVQLQLDVRIVPGFDPQDALKELDNLIGEWCELELTGYSASTGYLDMGLFDTLSEILLEGQTDASTFPFLVMGGTDGRFFSELNIQTYGYLPMDLPDDFTFLQTIHAADERIPVEAMDFGTDKIFKVLHHFHD